MPNYRFKALGSAGEVHSGEMEGESRDAVAARLQAMGRMPFQVVEAKEQGVLAWLDRDIFASSRLRNRDLAIFTHQLAMLLKAGLPIDRSLDLLSRLGDSKQVRGVIGQLLERVRGGASLADAMAVAHPAFPRICVSLVRAGETGDTLQITLTRLSDFLARSEALRETVKSAMVYPAILLVMAVASIGIVMTVVLPQFEPLFRQAGKSLPLSTQIVMFMAHFIQGWWWAMGLATVALVIWWRAAAREARFLLRWHGFLLRTPLVRDFIVKSETARFSRTLGTVLGNGVPLSTALDIAHRVVGNAAMGQALQGVAARLKEGEGLADPLNRTGMFPELSVQFIRVGEETGRLEEMLHKQADIYDDELKRSVERFLALLVPGLTVILGLIIGGIVASIFAAILSINTLAT